MSSDTSQSQDASPQSSTPPSTPQLTYWKSDAGDDYTYRNVPDDDLFHSRVQMWERILNYITPFPMNILEVGAGGGQNLGAIQLLAQNHVYPPHLYAVEPNKTARQQINDDDSAIVRDGQAENIPFPNNFADLVFTSGVLIHIPPERLLRAYSEIYRTSSRYIVSIEYFSKEPEMIPYRGKPDLLWKRDFGALWLDTFPNLKPVACGFEWSRTTNLDDLTWWIFEKP